MRKYVVQASKRFYQIFQFCYFLRDINLSFDWNRSTKTSTLSFNCSTTISYLHKSKKCNISQTSRHMIAHTTSFAIANSHHIITTCNKFYIKQNTNVKRRWNKLLSIFTSCLVNSSAKSIFDKTFKFIRVYSNKNHTFHEFSYRLFLFRMCRRKNKKLLSSFFKVEEYTEIKTKWIVMQNDDRRLSKNFNKFELLIAC